MHKALHPVDDIVSIGQEKWRKTIATIQGLEKCTKKTKENRKTKKLENKNLYGYFKHKLKRLLAKRLSHG